MSHVKNLPIFLHETSHHVKKMANSLQEKAEKRRGGREFWMLNVGKFPRGRMMRAGQGTKLTKAEPKKKPPLTVRQHPGADKNDN